MEEVIYSNNHKYEVVDKIPKGYMIWNIGSHNMVDDYLPLCEWLDKERFTINANTLKAIKVDGAKEILNVICCGNYSDKNGIRRMYKDLTLKKCTKRQRELILNALPHMKKLNWE